MTIFGSATFLLPLPGGAGYDLFILLKSSRVILPSGGGVFVAFEPRLGEFEAEIDGLLNDEGVVRPFRSRLSEAVCGLTEAEVGLFLLPPPLLVVL